MTSSRLGPLALSRKRAHDVRRHCILASLVLLVLLVLGTPLAAFASEGEYTATLGTGAVCLDGRHDVADENGFSGELTLSVDDRGRVTGTLRSGSTVEPVRGKHSVRASGQKLTLTGSKGRTKFKFSGWTTGNSLVGTLKDKAIEFMPSLVSFS